MLARLRSASLASSLSAVSFPLLLSLRIFYSSLPTSYEVSQLIWTSIAFLLMKMVASFSQSLKNRRMDVRLHSSELSKEFDGFCLKLFI